MDRHRCLQLLRHTEKMKTISSDMVAMMTDSNSNSIFIVPYSPYGGIGPFKSNRRLTNDERTMK